MTSPYLNKPRRKLHQALKDRGLSANDIGWQDHTGEDFQEDFMSGHGRWRDFGFRLLACAIIVAGGMAITYGVLNPQPQIADLQEEEMDRIADEELNGIMPAAGPESMIEGEAGYEDPALAPILEEEAGTLLDPANME